MDKILGVIGAGDLGKQIAHYALSDNHYDNVVFFDDFIKPGNNNVIGKIIDVENSYKNGVFNELIIAIGYKHIKFKEEIYNKFKNSIPLGTIIHSSSWVDKTATVNEGTVVFPNCTIDLNVKIGFNSILNIGCTISHDSSLGNHCFLSPKVSIAGFTRIGEKCIIGINSTIIDNLIICDNTQIGAGGVVIKNIQKEGLYVGNPVRFLR